MTVTSVIGSLMSQYVQGIVRMSLSSETMVLSPLIITGLVARIPSMSSPSMSGRWYVL